jgi:hypothetical protein
VRQDAGTTIKTDVTAGVDEAKTAVGAELKTFETDINTDVAEVNADANVDIANATASAKAALAHINSSGIISNELQAAKNFLERAITWIENHVKAAV